MSAHIFGRRFCITIDRGRSSTGKAQKFYSMANCGMRVAMDIGVIREDVMGFYRYLRRADCDLLGANLVAKIWGDIGFTVAKGCGNIGCVCR